MRGGGGRQGWRGWLTGWRGVLRVGPPGQPGGHPKINRELGPRHSQKQNLTKLVLFNSLLRNSFILTVFSPENKARNNLLDNSDNILIIHLGQAYFKKDGFVSPADTQMVQFS